uniref:VWFA domain-containing protein n=1 Tax=Arcella intermedia TaxID=1963864 RepID=A0A6B2L1C9_9EUKA
MVKEREDVLDVFIKQFKVLYGQRCTYKCSCSNRYCPGYTQFQPTQCASNTSYGTPSFCSVPGRMADFNASSVRVPSVGVPDNLVKTVQCWSSGIDPYFAQYSGITLWRYLGTPQGFFRSYPGSDRVSCTDYDPRTRPWYIAASSGPKDVVLILDTSGSMSNFNRISLAKAAATKVLNTLTINDYIGVVQFSNGASIISSPSGLLLPATLSNLLSVQAAVDNIAIGGETNYEKAFQMAFQMIRNSKTQEKSTGCETLILFLTDGVANLGAVDDALLGEIATLNAGVDAKIFTYSLGAQAAVLLPKAIACANNGVWAQINDGGDLSSQMGNYYNYLASSIINRTRAVWTEPYVDASGAGLVVTVAKAFYDETASPPLFLGVVGIDVKVDELLAVATSDQLLEYLVYRAIMCPVVSITPCGLEFMRSQVVNENGATSKCEVNLTCPERDIPQQSCLQQGIDYGFCNVVAGSEYTKEAACCPEHVVEGGPNIAVIVGCAVGIPLGVLLLVGIGFLIYDRCSKTSHVTTTTGVPQSLKEET